MWGFYTYAAGEPARRVCGCQLSIGTFRGSEEVAGSSLVTPDGVACLPKWLFLSLKRPWLTFLFPIMETFASLLFKLDWPPRTAGLGSERPADFVCLFDSGTWLSVPEPVYD